MTSSRPTEPGRAGGPFTVAILGKPNVGKSTLFNRLIGRRRAITHSEAGVTRDLVEAELWVRDLRCLLVDTGGYNRAEGAIERLVAQRSLDSAATSDLLLLVVECSGLSGEDRDFVEKLRRYEQKVILVVNKADSEVQEMALGEFFELGFPHVIPVSAEANRNLDELREAIYAAARSMGVQAIEEPGDAAPAAEDLLRLAIIGKPNTGKSTLLNRLLERERAIVSDIPGTTRDPVTGDFLHKGVRIRVVDTAGIRRRSKVTENVEYYSVNRAIRSLEEADIALLVVDAEEGLAEQDKKIASLAVRKGRGLVIVLSKWDRKEKGREVRREAIGRIRFQFPILEFAPIVPISARTGRNVSAMLDVVLALWEQLRRKVPTHRLNRLLREWLSEYPLPVRGRNVKLRYATQTGVNPVRFVFFVNSRRAYPARYTRYLENRIRGDLGFDKVPVSVEIRES